MWRRLILGGVLLAGLVAAAMPLRADGGTTLTVDGYVNGGDFKSGVISFTLDRMDQRFELNASFVPDADGLYQAISDSASKDISVTVHFDPDTAYIDSATSRPTYIARSIEFQGKTYVGDTASPARSGVGLLGPREQAEFALGRGIAYANAGDTKTARPLLDAALNYPELSAGLKALAAKARGGVIEGEALINWPVGDERDRLMLAALTDFKTWSKLAPDDEDAIASVASAYAELGAYAEARKLDEDAAARWSDRAFWSLVGIARIDRMTGDLAASLRDLDKVQSLAGATAGMPYHYHRGWTLAALGRDEEAIDEFTEGLKAQPDYAWAYLRRSCSEAALGRLTEALDDYNQGASLARKDYKSIPDGTGKTADLARLDQVAARLQSALAQDPRRKISGLCDGYWDWGDETRARSKLLPPSP